MALRLRNYSLARMSMSVFKNSSGGGGVCCDHGSLRRRGSTGSLASNTKSPLKTVSPTENQKSHYGRFVRQLLCSTRTISSESLSNSGVFLDENTYEAICAETLDSLCEHVEEVLELYGSNLSDTDVTLASGVLTVNLGKKGIYVVNKQAPNKQVWLSSPLSGPKRYDYQSGCWVYKHDGVGLHELLSQEFSSILESQIDFTGCSFGAMNVASPS